MRDRLSVFLFLLVLLTSLLGGLLGNRVAAGSNPPEDERLMQRFTSALALVESRHFRDVEAEDLVESAIQGLLRTLDPHSSFFATSDYSRLQEEQQGKYYGLGITIRPEAPGSGRVLVVDPPAPGTPAYRAGIKAGDVIFEISGEPIEDWDVNEDVIPHLKGPKGTTVDITIERAGEAAPLHITVERDEIPLHTIKYAFSVRPGIGYIRIDKFSETTADELDKALEDLLDAHMQSLILDLRGNPGGALSAAIDVAARFLDRGQIVVSTRSRDSSEDRDFFTRQGTRREKFPMVVLIDQSSASASEIVAGALQDHKRALIVGETSFGKALVQTIYPLSGGKRGLALTTGKYYTPNNRLIQRDYSDGFYNYYYNRSQAAHAGTNSDNDATSDEGGIHPDETVLPEPASHLFRLIARKDLFGKFASEVWTGHIESEIPFEEIPEDYTTLDGQEMHRLLRESRLTDEVVEHFRDYLRQEGIEFDDSEFDQNADLFANQIQQRIYARFLGDVEGYKVSLETDRQMQRALELLPRARSLIEKPLATGG